MTTTNTSQVTQVLNEAARGDRDAARRLFVLLYDEFHRLAQSYLRHEGTDHTLQPTALVNELYLKMVDQKNVQWHGRTQFFAVGAMSGIPTVDRHAWCAEVTSVVLAILAGLLALGLYVTLSCRPAVTHKTQS